MTLSAITLAALFSVRHQKSCIIYNPHLPLSSILSSLNKTLPPSFPPSSVGPGGLVFVPPQQPPGPQQSLHGRPPGEGPGAGPVRLLRVPPEPAEGGGRPAGSVQREQPLAWPHVSRTRRLRSVAKRRLLPDHQREPKTAGDGTVWTREPKRHGATGGE